jgi:hypothetical protein
MIRYLQYLFTLLLLSPSLCLAAELRIYDCKGLLRLVEESSGLDTVEMLLAGSAQSEATNGSNPLLLSSMDGIAPDIVVQVPTQDAVSPADTQDINIFRFSGVAAGSWKLSRAQENGCPSVLSLRLQRGPTS